jgi:hypothetical protein
MEIRLHKYECYNCETGREFKKRNYFLYSYCIFKLRESYIYPNMKNDCASVNFKYAIMLAKFKSLRI